MPCKMVSKGKPQTENNTKPFHSSNRTAESESHIYEEISDQEMTTNLRYFSNNNSTTPIFLNTLDDKVVFSDTHKKSVRFIKASQNNNNTINPLMTVPNMKCILKKSPPNIQIDSPSQECLCSSHSPSSSSSGSSFSNGQIYTTNSIGSNSSTLSSTHSVAFNQMIDTFLNRFKNNEKKSSEKKKSKKSKVTENLIFFKFFLTLKHGKYVKIFIKIQNLKNYLKIIRYP